jgi:hypothetical protein
MPLESTTEAKHLLNHREVLKLPVDKHICTGISRIVLIEEKIHNFKFYKNLFAVRQANGEERATRFEEDKLTFLSLERRRWTR